MRLLKIATLFLLFLLCFVVPIQVSYAATPTITGKLPTYLLKIDDYEVFSVIYNDNDGWAEINYVELKITTHSAQTFTLRWTQVTDVFSEEIDASGICSIWLSGCSVQVISGTMARVNYDFQITAGATFGPVTYEFRVVDDAAHEIAEGEIEKLYLWGEGSDDMLIVWGSSWNSGVNTVIYGWGASGHIHDFDFVVDYELLDMYGADASLTAPVGPVVSNPNAIYVWEELTNKFSYFVFYMWNPTTIYHSFSATNAIYNSSTYNLSNLGLIDPGMVSIPITGITNMEGCGDWIFANEKYYNFVGTFNYTTGYTHLVNVSMKFTDGANWIIMSYNQTSGLYSVVSTPDTDNIIDFGTPSVTYFGNNTMTVTFPIFLRSGILDAYDVDIWTRSQDDLGVVTAWTVGASNYFNIYNLGGKAEYAFHGNGIKTPGGDIFYLQVTNDTDYARANATYRKVQHVHSLFSIDISNASINSDGWVSDEVYWHRNGFNLEIALWYCDPSHVWVKGLSTIIDINGGTIRKDEVTASGWSDIQFRVRWYDATGNLLKTDLLTSYNHLFNWDLDFSENPMSPIWIDMWFNTVNGSRIMGGRVCTYELGIWEDSSPIWTNGYRYGWGNATQSMCFTPVTDSNGAIISSKQLDLMKIAFNLTKPAAGSPVGASDNVIKLRDFDIFTLKRIIPAQGAMLGIDTPSSEFEPSKKVDLPAGGFLGGLVSVLMGIGGLIVGAFMYAIYPLLLALVSVLDAMFAFTGNPHLFSTIIAFASTLVAQLVSAILYIAQLIVLIPQLLVNGLTFVYTYMILPLLAILAFVFSPVTGLLSFVINMFAIAFAWMGGYLVVVNGLTYDFSGLYVMQYAGIHGGGAILALIGTIYLMMIPVFCLSRMSLDPLIAPIQLVYSLLKGIMTIVDFFIKLIMAIRKMLPFI